MAQAKRSADEAGLTAGGRIQGKVCVVTGGCQGIGRGVAKRFLEEGGKVAILDVQDSSKTATELRSEVSGAELRVWKCDISQEEEVKEVVTSVVQELGEIDVLVNNAARFVFKAVTDATEEDWDVVLGTNIKGSAFMAKHCIPSMKRNGGGSIINISSISAYISQPGFTSYSTTKAGLLQMTRCMALDHGTDHIRVNSVCPGLIVTAATAKHAAKNGVTLEAFVKQYIKDNIFLPYAGTPKNVADACLFLASDESSFVTGSSLTVDGGNACCKNI